MSKIKDVRLNGDKSLQIRKFDLTTMVQNPAIVMIAKRRSGKSWICRSILKHFNDIPVGIIIAPTEKMATPVFYSDFFPDSYIHYEYKSVTIEKLLIRQGIMIDKNMERAKNKQKHVDPRGFILMDDCLSSKGSWMKEQPILELLFNGRHYQLMYMLTMQFPLGISPELRGNFDYIFLLKENFQSNLKRIYDHYAGICPTFEAFRIVFKSLTSDYGAMVVVNNSNSIDFFDQVFWYRAENESIGKIGCKQFLDYHINNYDDEWKKKERQFNIMDIGNKKNNKNPDLKVQKMDVDRSV
jgi:hypothetical protein